MEEKVLSEIYKQLTKSTYIEKNNKRKISSIDIENFLKAIKKVILHDFSNNGGLMLEDLSSILRKVQVLMQDENFNQALNKNDSLKFVGKLPLLQDLIMQDIQAAFLKDPAAKSTEEIALTYPGIFAIMVHRISHELYKMGYSLISRLCSEHAHSKTGIDIHPGAKIGDSFFIDHGTGIVIGETTIIGNNVTIYQGVTLGAFSFQHDENGEIIKGIKRHPTIEDDVTIYAGATILGGETKIGKESIIGGNVWLTESVPPKSKVISKFQVKIVSS